MPNDFSPQLCYPYNLMLAVKSSAAMEFPARLTADMEAGLHYALSTLPEMEQRLLQLYYREGKSCQEIAPLLAIPPDEAEALRGKAVKKLRLPSRWNYIRFGVAGYLKKETANHYSKGYHIGYMEGYQDGTSHTHGGKPISQLETDVCIQPIEFLELSPRAYNALFHAGYTHIGDLVGMEEFDIRKIRNMGQKSADEVARALIAKGIAHTVWYQFLL